MNIFFSPHLDDVIFSCGGLLLKGGKNTVFTIFAGEYNGLTSWDYLCGIRDSNPVSIRKKEDLKALKIVKAKAVHCSFLDNAFYTEIKKEKRKDKEDIRKKIFNTAQSYDKVFFPLGIDHPDHIIVAEIGKELSKKRKGVFFYEDFPYSLNYRRNKGLPVKKVCVDIDKKIDLASLYSSQSFAVPTLVSEKFPGRTLEKLIYIFSKRGERYFKYPF